MIYNIIQELNENNSSNYKLEVLKKYQDNELLKRVLKMTYDKVQYNYYVTMKNVKKPDKHYGDITLEDALDSLEFELATRKITGNAAIEQVEFLLMKLSEEDAYVLEKILDRDLRINMGTKQINKVFKKLITSPGYLRCSLPNEKTLKNIEYPCFSQLKCDGRYCSVIKDKDKITFMARSGEVNDFPYLEEGLQHLEDGVYIGELLVHSEPNRTLANGMINSLTPPKDIYIVVWDLLTLEEWKNVRSDVPYKERFERLENITQNDFIEVVETKIVNSYEEAYEHFKEKISEGSEGTIIKDFRAIWRDGTSNQQIKMKPEMTIDVRCVGFIEGKGRFKNSLGALEFETDDKMLNGSCSGFTDEQRDEIWNNREKYLNKVFEVKCNDVTKAKNKDTYALSYPNFVEWRDKDETDDIQRVLDIWESVCS